MTVDKIVAYRHVPLVLCYAVGKELLHQIPIGAHDIQTIEVAEGIIGLVADQGDGLTNTVAALHRRWPSPVLSIHVRKADKIAVN